MSGENHLLAYRQCLLAVNSHRKGRGRNGKEDRARQGQEKKRVFSYKDTNVSVRPTIMT